NSNIAVKPWCAGSRSFTKISCGGRHLQLKRNNSVRTILREAVLATAIVLTAPCWALALLQTRWTQSEDLFALFSELLSLVPGLPGVLLRRGYYRMCLEEFARDGSIGFGTTVAHPQVRIGNGVYIGNRCIIGMVII